MRIAVTSNYTKIQTASEALYGLKNNTVVDLNFISKPDIFTTIFHTLSMSSTMSQFEFIEIVNVIQTNNSISTVFIQDGVLEDMCPDNVQKILRILFLHKTIKELSLNDSNIGDNGVMAIAQSLQSNDASNINYLNLCGAGITDTGWQYLAKVLANYNNRLHLQMVGGIENGRILKKPNIIRYAGAKALLNLASNNSHIRLASRDREEFEETVKNNEFLDGFPEILSGIERNTTTNLSFHLPTNMYPSKMFTDTSSRIEGNFFKIAGAIMNCSSLEQLEIIGIRVLGGIIYSYFLSPRTVEALATALRGNSSLKQVNFNNIGISDEEINTLVKAINDNPNSKIDTLTVNEQVQELDKKNRPRRKLVMR